MIILFLLIHYIFFKNLCMYVFGCIGSLGPSCGMQDPFHVQDLVLGSGIEPRPPALGGKSPSHWTTREVP